MGVKFSTDKSYDRTKFVPGPGVYDPNYRASIKYDGHYKFGRDQR